MNILEKKGSFEKRGSKRLPLKGLDTQFEIYRIPLEYLKYNINNDRIATFITQYTDETGDLPEDTEGFNKIVEDFIVESNEDAFKKTKKNVKALGQIEPAVVLSDGVVVDGNRRFTTLRQLYREVQNGKDKYGYLEAVILPIDKYTTKDIKRLELKLQHAFESKVDYNPIERLVGIYRDLIVDNHPFTIAEYADETQSTPAKVRQDVEIAKLLVDYLHYINQSEKFHVARRQKIDGPLREIHKILRSKKIPEEMNYDVKEFLFANLVSLDGDITRKIRDLKPVLENPESRNKLLEESEDMLDDISDNLSDSENIREGTETGIVNIEKETRQSLTGVTEKFVDNEKLDKAKNQPIEALKKSLERMESVDIELVIRLNDELQQEFSDYLNRLETQVQSYKDIIND